VLSQCDNLLLMRMNSEADLAHLRDTFSFVPAGLIRRATTFRQGESLVAGKFVPHPTYVRFRSTILAGGRCRHTHLLGSPRVTDPCEQWSHQAKRIGAPSRIRTYDTRFRKLFQPRNPKINITRNLLTKPAENS
jgi:hypothetical protein